MNINYTKELHDSITTSNDQFVEEEYQLDHAKSAAKLSLYYAHGNTEKNENNYRNIKADEATALKIDKMAVKAINLANNAVLVSKQSLIDAGKATNNVSTAAANMQIAANAITRLSSDVASMLAVANAADYDSQIQQAVENAYDKIRSAAQMAEQVSLISLKTTIEAAQSVASTVVTDAETTLSSVTNLQKSTAGRYDELANQAVAAHTKLTESKKQEKTAAANFDIKGKQDLAIKTTRSLINSISNDNILLFDPVLNAQSLKTKADGTSQTAAIATPKNPILPAVPIGPAVKVGESYTIAFNQFFDDTYIDHYRMIMVRWDQAQAFDISIAKDLSPGTFTKVEAKQYKGYSRTFYLLGSNNAMILKDPRSPNSKPSVDENGFENWDVRGIAVDYLGKPVERGTYYVAFVYAVFTDDFQRQTNSVDGYLSLPSHEMRLQRLLQKSGTPSLIQPVFNSKNFGVSFQVSAKDYDAALMEYRIMLLESQNVKANNINIKIQQAIDDMDAAEYKYNIEKQQMMELIQKLNRLEIAYNTMDIRQHEASELFSALSKKINSDGSTVTPAMQNEYDALQKEIANLQSQMNDNLSQQKTTELALYNPPSAKGYDPNKKSQQQIVNDAKAAYDKAVGKEASISKTKISDFIFDTDLMSVVSPANYYVAKPILSNWTSETAKANLKESGDNVRLQKDKLFDKLEQKLIAKMDFDEADNAYQEAQAAVVEAEVAISKCENDLDDAEYADMLSSDNDQGKAANNKSEKDDDSETTKDKVEKAIDALVNAQNDLIKKQESLNEAKIIFDQAQNKVNEASLKVGGVSEAFIKAIYADKKAKLILGMVELQLKLNPDFQQGADTDSVADKKLVFYTEIGENATDNYGEPLQANQVDVASYVDAIWSKIESKLKDEDISFNKKNESKVRKAFEEFIENELEKSDIEEYLNELGKSSFQFPATTNEPWINYQAMVLTAINSTQVEQVNDYQVEPSDYSNLSSLYQSA